MDNGVAPSFLAWSLRAPTSTRWRTTSRWPSPAAINNGVSPSTVCWSLSAPASTKWRTTSSCPLSAATCNGVIPSGPWSGAFFSAPASISNCRLSTCPLPAAQCNGVMPLSSLTFGFKGFFSKFSSSIKSLLMDAEIIRRVCSASVWKKSKITIISITGAEAKISSSGISEPSSEKSLCLKMVTSILAAKTCFTAFALFPSNSSGARTVSFAPDARKHTSIAKRLAVVSCVQICKIMWDEMWEKWSQHFTKNMEHMWPMFCLENLRSRKPTETIGCHDMSFVDPRRWPLDWIQPTFLLGLGKGFNCASYRKHLSGRCLRCVVKIEQLPSIKHGNGKSPTHKWFAHLFPLKTPCYKEFSIAMFDSQKVL